VWVYVDALHPIFSLARCTANFVVWEMIQQLMTLKALQMHRSGQREAVIQATVVVSDAPQPEAGNICTQHHNQSLPT